MAALVAPRLVVVGDDDGVEAALLGQHAELDELARAELLGGGLVADSDGHGRESLRSAGLESGSSGYASS